MCRLIDNVSYAKETFLESRRIKTFGEFVIEKDALKTVVGLICTGSIPETITMKIEHNNLSEPVAEVIVPDTNELIFCRKSYERKLSSYVFLKNFKFKSIKEGIKISNINISEILNLFSPDVCYSDIIEEGDEYRLIYSFKERKEG